MFQTLLNARAMITRHLSRAALVALTSALALLASSCGTGGEIPGLGVGIKRKIPDSVLQQKTIAYSPYRSADRNTETITAAMIEQDLRLLAAAGFGVIRLFDASDAVAKQVLQVITTHSLPIKVMLGMYVNPNAESANQAELDRGIALAKAYSSTVVSLSVGNEKLVYWSALPMPVDTIAGYIRKVRNATNQPVTTNDNWAFWSANSAQNGKNPDAVLAEVDFVAMHTYPLLDTIHNPNLWNWQQSSVAASARAAAMMDAALARAQLEHKAVRDHLDGLGYTDMVIVIGETGWKADPSGGETQRAHPVNQKMYFDRLESWKASGTGPKTVVHFQAFDEPWKMGDDKWGAFNVQRQARCVAQALNPSLAAASGSCATSAALYHIPPVTAGPITAARFTVYAETTTSGEARPASAVVLNAWENGTTASAAEVDDASGDGSKAMRITPTPLAWGWGMTWGMSGAETDLSNFVASTARLNFRIKTSYSGKLEFGFLTGSATDSNAYDVYLAVSPGQYGYQNNDQWQTVSIPVSALTASGKPAFNMPSSATLNMARVSNFFVVADRYDVTKNASGAKPVILVDDIHWTQ